VSGAEDSPGTPAQPGVPVFEAPPAFEEDFEAPCDPIDVVRVLFDARTGPGAQCRLLASRLRALGRDKRLRRVGVAGCETGEGSSTVALGLARALSDEPGQRVLLLELDLEHPALDERLGLRPPTAGLRRYLEGGSDVPVLRRSGPDGFWLLSAGPGSDRGPSLASPRLLALLRAVDVVFDYLVADCPPLLGGGGARALRDHLDGFVYVVRSRRAPRETIRRAAAALRAGSIAGIVLNAQRDVVPRRG
jgi:Mrp family chromosome partitioning ATPase